MTLEAGEHCVIELVYAVAPCAGASFDTPSAAFQLNLDVPRAEPEAMLEQAVALAREADVTIVVVGTTAIVIDSVDVSVDGWSWVVLMVNVETWLAGSDEAVLVTSKLTVVSWPAASAL